MERSNSMAREKRTLDLTSTDEDQPERKRPALARFIFFNFFIINRLLLILFSYFLAFGFDKFSVNDISFVIG